MHSRDPTVEDGPTTTNGNDLQQQLRQCNNAVRKLSHSMGAAIEEGIAKRLPKHLEAFQKDVQASVRADFVNITAPTFSKMTEKLQAQMQTIVSEITHAVAATTLRPKDDADTVPEPPAPQPAAPRLSRRQRRLRAQKTANEDEEVQWISDDHQAPQEDDLEMYFGRLQGALKDKCVIDSFAETLAGYVSHEVPVPPRPDAGDYHETTGNLGEGERLADAHLAEQEVNIETYFDVLQTALTDEAVIGNFSQALAHHDGHEVPLPPLPGAGDTWPADFSDDSDSTYLPVASSRPEASTNTTTSERACSRPEASTKPTNDTIKHIQKPDVET